MVLLWCCFAILPLNAAQREDFYMASCAHFSFKEHQHADSHIQYTNTQTCTLFSALCLGCPYVEVIRLCPMEMCELSSSLSLLSLVFNVLEKKSLGVQEDFSFPSPPAFLL